MNFQILNLILYNHEGAIEKLDFELGKLNIISGESQTGKTALLSIIDYCLGSGHCHIPRGYIRNTVSWVAIRLKLIEGEVFIARKIPDISTDSSSEIYYEIGQKIDIKEYSELSTNINLISLRNLLSKHVGIHENSEEMNYGRITRLESNIRHTTHFIFQHQTEISNNKFLFHKQGEQHGPNTIRAVLPYFLGAYEQDHVRKMKRLQVLRSELYKLNRNLKELESIKGDGISQAQLLLFQSKDFGLYGGDIPENWSDCIELLKDIMNKSFNSEMIIEGNAFEELQEEELSLRQEGSFLQRQLRSVEKLFSDGEGYSKEAEIHLMRLKSLELFDEESGDLTCPICNSSLEDNSIATINDLKESFSNLNSQMSSVEKESPQLQKAIRELKEKLDSVNKQLDDNKKAIDSIQKNTRELREIKEYNNRLSFMKGKISLYLDSLPQIEDGSDLLDEIKTTKDEIDSLNSELISENIEERLNSIMNIINNYMGSWAKEFELEHSESVFRLDIKKLTVIADTESGPITMDSMGSAENWLGCHLMTYFALHKWFVKQLRPLPRFLLLDQPSQVYFPEEIDFNEDEEDNRVDVEKVKKIYKSAIDLTNELESELQIIMTDHANFNDEWFQECVIANWREGNKLVPTDW
ncbi:MAG: DUF3732 domain-containing protein [Methanobacteriaceae archaeon]|nr:DUF3732 domain-containing protein [Methanobacteriaceae archaeon]MDP2835397.1 DUF3732 domain-containing protein [Methanobacteriaceae archaeon]MDP3035043.1 DUF3732 domain-containing protein [Methanobacteriaceae archaeon]MDP3486040.1 DUF3732 domain-containing protein [Methanobacteriaceae archaeon]MDP3623639.1 DUF3732 domain-containing protein [Methanobacteriaceae archaeon]